LISLFELDITDITKQTLLSCHTVITGPYERKRGKYCCPLFMEEDL